MTYQELKKFLEEGRVKKELQEVFYTHVSLIEPKGRFQINKDNFERFWELYSNVVGSPDAKSRSLGLAERPQSFLPVLVDIDIKIEGADDYIPGQKIIQDRYINSTVQIYHSILRQLIANCQDSHLICFVLEKPSYIKKYGDKEYIKNGFHLHFPNIFLNKSDHEAYLIPKIKGALNQHKIFEDLGFVSGDLLDKSYVKVPWLLYGGKKDVGMDTYTVTKIYDAEMNEISLGEALGDITIYDSEENPISYDRNLEWYLPRVLSILPFGRKTAEISTNVLSIAKINILPKTYKETDKKYSEVKISEELKKADKFLGMLSSFRVEDRNEWISVGWTLYNIGKGSPDALELWLKFSRRSEDKFEESVCIEQWGHMNIKNMGIATLAYMAKKDNPRAYENYIQETLKNYIKENIENSCFSHTDIAKTLLMKYGTEFKCVSVSQNIWYQYRNHRWVKTDSGVALSKKISDDSPGTILHTLNEKYKELTLLASSGNEGEKAMHTVRARHTQKIISSLKSAPFKRNVMRECAEVFEDEFFAKKIDRNPHLIGFKNGVYDLDKFQFREGLPEDYISLQLNVEYRDFTGTDQKVVEIKDYLEKIFPDKSIRDYFMDISCNIFVGGNRQKHVYFWSGEGDNGKSVTQNIFEKMLGEYAVKLPTSLIVGKRTQASAACPELVRAGNGVRWAVLQEPDKKDIINIGILKELSGNDTFFARGLYKEGAEMQPMFKLVVICNDPPLIPHSDKATWNRIRVIPFESTFCEDAPPTQEEQLLLKRFPVDRNFDDKIPEMIQALAWLLLEHRKIFNRSGYKCVEPEKVKIATAYYKKKNDIYRQFIEECVTESKQDKINLMEVYRTFKDWHRESLPGVAIPVKNDMKEYLVKCLGDPHENSWHGYKIISATSEDDGRPTL